MASFITWLLLGASAGLAALAIGVSTWKWHRAKKSTHRHQIEAAFRPRLVELLAEEDAELDELASAATQKGDVGSTVDDMAISLMSKLRGEDRRILRDLLVQRNAFVRAQNRTRSFVAARRARAVELLGDGDVHAATPEVTWLLDDRSIEVRKAAARALGKLGAPESVPVLMSALKRGRVPTSVVGMAILHIGMAATDELSTSLLADDPKERRMAADCLGSLGIFEAVSAIARLVGQETNNDVSRAAIRALGRLGSPAGIEALTGLGPDTAAEVRAEAATALGWIGGDDAIAGLDVALGDSEPIVIRAATGSLRLLGRPGTDRLEALALTEGKAGAFAREALDLTRMRTAEGRAA